LLLCIILLLTALDNDENADSVDEKSNDLNDVTEKINSNCDSDILAVSESLSNKEKSTSDIEILDNEINSVQTNGDNNQTNMEVDEVVLDSTEEEDASETKSNHFIQNNSFDKYEEIQINSDYNKEDSDLQGKVLVLPDSDSDTENYLADIKPEVKHENFPVRETLHLTFEETFFLMYGLGCLRVIDFDGKYLNIGEIWDYFCKEQKCFLQKYVTYHYFRSKGWVVKPGLKYGGDFCKLLVTLYDFVMII
jgi:tRNA-splicing endonuclease subunit Sen2